MTFTKRIRDYVIATEMHAIREHFGLRPLDGYVRCWRKMGRVGTEVLPAEFIAALPQVAS